MSKVYFIKAEDGRLIMTAKTAEGAKIVRQEYAQKGIVVKIVESE